MNPRALAAIGTTGVRVTRLGLGGAPLGGLYAPVAEPDAAATVETAWRCGVRFFDTAPLYGHGRSEARLGRYLAGYPRDEFALATKVGRLLVASDAPGPSGDRYEDPFPFEPVFDFSRDGVLRSFEQSLARLGVDRVDLLHIHDPDEHFEQAIAQAYPAIAHLKAQGAIRAISAGMNQWQMLARFAREADFDAFLLAGRYTLLDQSALAELLPLCVARGIGVVLGGPYNSGILAAGSRGAGHYDYESPSAEIVRRTARIEAVCERHGVPLRAAALQFPFGHPAIAAVVPGARSAAEVEDNVAAMTHPVPPDLWRELKDAALIDASAPVPRANGAA